MLWLVSRSGEYHRPTLWLNSFYSGIFKFINMIIFTYIGVAVSLVIAFYVSIQVHELLKHNVKFYRFLYDLVIMPYTIWWVIHRMNDTSREQEKSIKQLDKSLMSLRFEYPLIKWALIKRLNKLKNVEENAPTKEGDIKP